MKIKKIVAVAMATAMALSVFANGGAEKSGSKDGKVVLKIMGYGDNANAEGMTFKRICEEFMDENPDIVLDTELLYDEAYHQKVVARLAAGDVPDIAYMGADARWGASWQEAGVQVDNTKFFPSNIDVASIPDFFGNGNRPYLPLGASNYCTVVAVNMKLLNQINGGKLPATYKELVDLAAKCKAAGIECMSTHGADGWVWGSCVMSGILPRTTGDLKWVEKAVQGKVKWTDAGAVAALDVLAQWVKDGVMSKDAVLVDDGTGKSNFANGKYLMYIDGQWAMGESSFGDLAKDIKLIPIPQVPGEKANAGAIAGAWQVGYGITKAGASDPKKLEAAKKWLEYFFSTEEIMQKLRDGAISAPILKNFKLPNDLDPCIAQKATLGKYPSAYVIDSYLTGTPNDILNAGMQDIVAGKQTAKQVAEAVQKAFDAR